MWWTNLGMILLGGIGGYLFHAISMKVSFKQRTIDNKIKVYDSIIAHWVKMRNFIYHSGILNDPKAYVEFDKFYGDFQIFIGEAILVSEDNDLVDDINSLNERLYRTDWQKLEHSKVNEQMEDIKKVAFGIIKRMQNDVKRSTVLEFSDFLHIWRGLRNKVRNQFSVNFAKTDQEFLNILKRGGLRFAKLYYIFVRLFGWMWWYRR